MKQFLIPVEEFLAMKKQLDRIETKLDERPNDHSPGLEHQWLTIEEVCTVLNISRRQLQKYRDDRVLPFSQYKNKIYFLAGDIATHLKKHYRPALNRRKEVAK